MSGLKERIREVRNIKNLTAGSFAVEVGEKVDSLRNTESGKKKVTGDLLQNIVEIFGVNAHWLLTGQGQMHSKQEAKQVKATVNHITTQQELKTNQAKAEMVAFIDDFLENASEEKKHWFEIQMERCFPEFIDFKRPHPIDSALQKKQVGE